MGVERIALAPRRCTRSAPRALSASDRAVYAKDDGAVAKWDPTRHKVLDVVDALEANALLDRDIEQPVWLNADDPDSIDERETSKSVFERIATSISPPPQPHDREYAASL